MHLKLKTLPIVFALMMLTMTSVPVDAQATEEASDNKLLTQSRELFQSIDEGKEELNRLRLEIDAASGGDREALEERASGVIESLIRDLTVLSTNVIAREEDGQDAARDRQQVEEMLQRVGEYFHERIDTLNTELADLRNQRDEATPEELAEIEDRIVDDNNRLDQSLQQLLEKTDEMESFGLDATNEKVFLEEELLERAELLIGRIELARNELDNIARRIKADPENADLKVENESTRQRLELYVKRLDWTAGMMDKLGLETAEYRQLLFEVTGEITTGLLSRDVLGGLLSTWTGKAIEWFTGNAPRIFFKVVLFFLILLLFRILSKIARKIVLKAIRSSNLEGNQLLERTAQSITGTVVMILGILVALSQFGVEIAPVLAGLGVVGFIVGFALQDTLANFASGVMILLYRPYDVGDMVDVAGAFGKVRNMSLVATTILTVDHQTLVIPNNKIWGDVIKNVTAQKIRRVDMVFGIAYSDDIPHAERVLEEILTEHDGVLEDPAPVVKLHNLGESSVDFVVRPWAKTDDYWDIYWDITREVKMRFDKEGISIPFPQRDVHVFEEKAG